MRFVWLALIALLLALPAQAGRTLAVLEFDVDSGDPQHAPLGRGIANMLITDLQRTGSVDVVERTRLAAVLAELDLQQTGYIDPESAVSLGRVTGATDVVVGGITSTSGQMRIDARVVDVRSGGIAHTATAEGSADAFFPVFEQLVRDLMGSLDASVTAENEKQFALRKSGGVDAAVKYGEAVTAYDAGEYDRAREATAQVAEALGGGEKLRKRFTADIEPLPPRFLLLGVTVGARATPLPGGSLLAGSVELGVGFALSERFFVAARATLLTAASVHELVPAHKTTPIQTRYWHRPVELGMKVRLGTLGRNGLFASGSVGGGPGRQISNTTDQVFFAVSGSFGPELAILRYERQGVLLGLHATAAQVDLGAPRPGLLASGPHLLPGVELRLASIVFGGRR